MRKLMIVVMAVALALCSCGDDQPEGQAMTMPSHSAAVTEPDAVPVAEADAVPVEQLTPALETQLTTDIVYHPADNRFKDDSGLTDVIAPIGDGPWPTVVVFHGDPRTVSKSWHRPDATMIAEQGRVVFLPAWGHTTLGYDADVLEEHWDLVVRELTCAVAFAHATTEEYGGDPDHITLYGLSAGGSAVLMAGLTGAEPLDTCVAPEPAVEPKALVPIDADWVLGGGWDLQLSANPEAFYSFTPYRSLDGSQDLPIYVMVTEDTSLVRSVEPDPATSWLSYRHVDIDLPAELQAMDFLDDGDFSMIESAEYGYQVLLDAGYDTTLVRMPGARHSAWGEEGTQVVVDTVLEASSR